MSKPRSLDTCRSLHDGCRHDIVNRHTYASSLCGVPHGSETISGNDMDGQVWLHFTNSMTHFSKQVDGYHKEAIEYAWKNSLSGHR